VVFRVLPDPATVFLELQNENLDSAALSPLQFNRQIQTDFFRKNYRSYNWSGQQYSYLAYNLTSPLFSDRRVRQALAMATDRDQIVRAVLLGRGRMLSGPFLPESWAYDPAVKPFPYDPKAARELLAQAGWRDTDGDGLLDRDGRKFSLTNGANDQRKMTCEMLQAQLARIGVEMRIQVMEWSTLLKEFIHPRRFEAVLLGWNLALDPDIYDIFHSSRTRPGQFNFVSFDNAEADRLMEKGRTTFDRSEREAAYRSLHRLIHQEQPYLFLFTSESLSVLHRRFEGVTEGKLGIGHDFTRWYVPEGLRKYRSPVVDE
jgi:peptide/nickel transport system substrate-binding protein